MTDVDQAERYGRRLDRWADTEDEHEYAEIMRPRGYRGYLKRALEGAEEEGEVGIAMGLEYALNILDAVYGRTK